jgi:hypothetical protein
LKDAIVILGDLSSENVPLEHLAAEFDWSLEKVSGQEGLARAVAEHIVPAVLFDPGALKMPWHQALRVVRKVAPASRPIVCHRFSGVIPWPELVDAGAFHSLRLPLDLWEVRQSFGFVWAASSSQCWK